MEPEQRRVGGLALTSHGTGGPPADDLIAQLGSVIARERASRHLTIAELAEQAGMSSGLLSQIERGIGNPSIDTTSKIARALGLPIGTFFIGSKPSNGVVHPKDRKRLVLANHDLSYELLVPDLQGMLSMLRVELPAGFSNESAPFSHPGEEAMLLVAGRVTVHLGAEIHHMEANDSLRFLSAMDHWYSVEGDEPAVVISAMTPPSF